MQVKSLSDVGDSCLMEVCLLEEAWDRSGDCVVVDC